MYTLRSMYIRVCIHETMYTCTYVYLTKYVCTKKNVHVHIYLIRIMYIRKVTHPTPLVSSRSQHGGPPIWLSQILKEDNIKVRHLIPLSSSRPQHGGSAIWLSQILKEDRSQVTHPNSTFVQSIPTWRFSNPVEPDFQRGQNKSYTSHPAFVQSIPTWRISNLVEPHSHRGQNSCYTSHPTFVQSIPTWRIFNVVEPDSPSWFAGQGAIRTAKVKHSSTYTFHIISPFRIRFDVLPLRSTFTKWGNALALLGACMHCTMIHCTPHHFVKLEFHGTWFEATLVGQVIWKLRFVGRGQLNKTFSQHS